MIRRWLVAGLLVWLPLGATLLVINFIAGLLDASLLLIPGRYRPEALLGFHIPGLGALLSLVILLLTGALAANFIGRRVLGLGEDLVGRIPVLRSIYSGVKKLSETVLAGGDSSFRQVLLVEYPRRDMWAVAFRSSTAKGEMREKLGDDMVVAFVPTTPNPTSGFVVVVHEDETIPLDMSVEDGLRMIISMGVMTQSDTETLVPATGKAYHRAAK